MRPSRAIELARLSAVTSETDLSLEELAALPAYVGADPNRDCTYDGSLLEFSYRPPLMAQSGELTLAILGPFWDRLFRIEFSGVTGVELCKLGPTFYLEVRRIELDLSESGSRCKIVALGSETTVTVTYTAARVSRHILQAPLERTS